MTTSSKRRFVELLPPYLRTNDLRKFFSATVDQVFQPGNTDPLSGYIGQYPEYYDPTKDFYIAEPDVSRQEHQLEATMFSNTVYGNSRVLFYDDLVDYIRANGGNVTDESRLFDNKFYSWAPPIDIDKIVNYQQYYWFDQNLQADESIIEQPVVQMVAPTANYTGNGVNMTFALPSTIDGLSAYEHPAIFVNNVSQSFTRSGNTVTVASAPISGALVEVYRYGDIASMFVGQQNFHPSVFMQNSTVDALTSGMVIQIIDALHRVDGWDLDPYDTSAWDSALQKYYVDGVNQSIVLTEYQTTPLDAAHMTINRQSIDQNPWSVNNRWVHKSAFAWSGVTFPNNVAKRPIIEFIPNVQLYNYGRQHITVVQCVLSGPVNVTAGWDAISFDADFFDSYVSLPVDQLNGQLVERGVDDFGTILQVGYTVLIAQDVIGHPELSQIIASIESVVDSDGNNVLALVPLEINLAEGDIVSIGTSGYEYSYLSGIWTKSQPFVEGTAPLFEMYDIDGISLGDVSVYANTTFTGNRIFGYQTGTGTNDTLLGFPLVYDSNGLITFQNDISVVRSYNANTEITGLYQYKILGATESDDVLRSDWLLNDNETSQSIISNTTANVYSIPLNLQANPENNEIQTITSSQWFAHFKSILEGQPEFSGSPYSTNNYRDTVQVLNIGTEILQHTSPLLRTMLLISDPTFDFPNAVRYVDHEYSRFRNRFTQQVLKNYLNGTIQSTTPSDWIAPILKVLKLGKTSSFPFALSNVGGSYNFIPPTPATLGIMPAVSPTIIEDDTFAIPVRYLVGHDGSRNILFGYRLNYIYQSGAQVFALNSEPYGNVTISVNGTNLASTLFEVTRDSVTILSTLNPFDDVSILVDDIRDEVLLALEMQIYNSIAGTFLTDNQPALYTDTFVSGKFRAQATNMYSIDEYYQVLAPMFTLWTQLNGLNYQLNNFDQTDPFTWNYRGTTDVFGEVVRFGHWRGLYRYYFDTDRPHSAPWEMLGFAQMPSWWTTQYGSAPYLNTNTAMWTDISNGNIASGPRAGIDARYIRPNLLSYLPVDANGELLDPVSARIVPYAPTPQSAQVLWQFGDGAPAEMVWRNSSSFKFSASIALFLLKPARYVEYFWDTLNTTTVSNQLIYIPTRDRPAYSVYNVHGEIVNGLPITVTGCQQWICEFMIYQGQTTSIFGNAVRGLTVKLGHKMAGFTTTDNLRILADNFGLMPNENINLVLYSSPSEREEFYGGVIVEWTGIGWKVYGYDVLNPTFSTIPGDPYGPVTTVVLDGTASNLIITDWLPNVYYKAGMLVDYKGSVYACITPHTSTTIFETSFWQPEPSLVRPQPLTVQKFLSPLPMQQQVNYGTVFYTQQDLANFLFDYERFLINQGWVFEETDTISGETLDWTFAVKQYLTWTTTGWAPGNFIALSPAALKATFSVGHGMVYDLDQAFRGNYGIVDRTGYPINRKDAYINRTDDVISVTVRDQNLFGLRLTIGEIEHAMLFDNETIFNDIVYQPLYNLRQPRLRVIGERAANWNGRLDAPGYILINNNVVPSFEKVVNDFRYMFDIEKSDNQTFRDNARHVVGFQKSTYLENLLIADTEQFEFYQGMIQQKGTPDVFSRIMRSNFVGQNGTIQFLEEWAIKVGNYGATDVNRRLAFGLSQSQITRDPQVLRITNNAVSTPEVVCIASSSISESKTLLDGSYFMNRPNLNSRESDLPTAGYVRLGETDYQEVTFDSLINDINIQTDLSSAYLSNEQIWIYVNATGTWDVLRINECSVDGTPNRIKRVVSANTVDYYDTDDYGARIYFENATNISSADIGATVIIDGFTRTTADLFGTQIISDFGSDTIGPWVEVQNDISVDYFWFFTESEPTDTVDTPASDPENAPHARIMRSIRFANTALRDAATTAWFTPNNNELCYVDNVGGPNGWQVFMWGNSAWTQYRSQPLRVDSSRIFSPLIYNQNTQITSDPKYLNQTLNAEPLLLGNILVFDPIAGLIPGVAQNEISYRLEFDPAEYDSQNSLWGAGQLGMLWWDVSAVRFLETYTDIIPTSSNAFSNANLIELNYRVSNWGKIAPGTSVNIYEWTRSLQAPTAFTGVGTVYNANSPAYVQTLEFNPQLNSMQTVYYYWVSGAQTIPLNSVVQRTLSASEVANIITMPVSNGIPWIAPIATDTLAVSGILEFLNNDSSNLQLSMHDHDYDGVIHSEWQLMRPEDETSVPFDSIWNKMVDSISGLNSHKQIVPDPSLSPELRQGIALRPRQSLFVGPLIDPRTSTLAARQSFVGMVNNIFEAGNYALTRSYIQNSLALVDYPGTVLNSNTYSMWTSESSNYVQYPNPFEYDYVVNTVHDRNKLLISNAFVNATSTIRVLLDRTGDTPSQWSIWNYDPTMASGTLDQRYSNASTLYQLAPSFDITVPDLASRDALLIGNTVLEVGKKVYVENMGTTYDNFWMIWLYDPTNARSDINGWALERAQLYNTSSFWGLTDWYASGYSALTPPIITYASPNARNVAEGANPTNVFVALTTDTDVAGAPTHWAWTYYSNGSWSYVARQNGTYALSNKFYNSNSVVYDGSEIDNISNRDGAYELRAIANQLRNNNALEDIELNELFFNMVHFTHATQDQVNWVFKTSFLNIIGFNQDLTQTPVATTDNTQNLIDYIEDVKPYRVKLREFSQVLSPPNELANITSADFDRPVYSYNNTYRILSDQSTTDQAILQTMPWSYWSNTYQNTGYDLSSYDPNTWNPVRRMTITLLFDRIDGVALVNPLAYTPGALYGQFANTITPSSTTLLTNTIVNGVVLGAAERITSYYNPSSSMPEKNLATLLNVGFNGVVTDGNNLVGQLPLDVIVTGANAANTSNNTVSVVINPDNADGSSSLKIADPYNFKRPEELVVIGNHDNLVIKVNSLGVPGAPPQTTKYFDVRRYQGNTATLSFGNISQSANAVMVYANGLRIANASIDYFNRTATIPLTINGVAVRNVILHSFGLGGTTSVIEQDFYTYTTGSPQSFGVTNSGLVTATVNGIPVTTNVVANTVTLNQSLNNGDDVMITVWGNGGAPTTVYSQTLTYNNAQTWSLSYPSTLYDTIIEANGLRLTPGIDFVISNGAVVIETSLNNNAAIIATTFSNTAYMGMNSYVLGGQPSGVYVVQTPINPASVWLTVNGLRATPLIDFTITPNSIVFPAGLHQTSDNIVINTFTATPAIAAHSFMAATVLPGKSIMRPYAEGDWDVFGWDTEPFDSGDAYVTANSTQGERILCHMDGGWEYYNISEGSSGLLAEPILATDNTITIKQSLQSSEVFRRNRFAVPQPNVPGVVWINGERIEYSNLVTSGANYVLSGIRRGTKGTTVGYGNFVHQANTLVISNTDRFVMH